MLRVRDRLISEVGPALMSVDPDHVVNAAMVDARVVTIGPHDRVRSDLFVTMFARHEAARSAGSAKIVERLHHAAVEASGIAAATVELVLNEHRSSFDYAAVE